MTDSMIASVLHLSHKDIKALKLNNWETFDYTLHKIVYQLFTETRSAEDKKKDIPSGFLYADKGADAQGRKVLLLSNRQPIAPEHGEINSKRIAFNFLDYKTYRFEVVVNPVKSEPPTIIESEEQKKLKKGKIIPLKTREEIAAWFIEKAVKKENNFDGWGFEVSAKHLEVRDIQVKRFMAKDAREITLAQAKVVGILTITDKEKFKQSFQQGIGRGRAFGCGLLQIVPI